MAFGCGVELPGLEPPTNTLYYPSSTTDLGNGELLIVNGNFDLKFKTAWLNVVDLSGALESGQDEASIESFMTGENLRILSHPGRVSFDNGEILLPHRGANHRGEALVSAINVNEGQITCGSADGEISSSMTTLEKATGCNEVGLIRLMPDGTNESSQASLTDETIFEGSFEGAFHAHQFIWNDGVNDRNLAAVAFLSSNWLWLFEKLDDVWEPIMLTILPVSATGDMAYLEFNGKPQLLISGRGNTTSPGRFVMMDITETMISGDYEGESFPFSDGLLARESVKIIPLEQEETLLALTRSPNGVIAISLDAETRIESDNFRKVPSFDLIDFQEIEGRVLDLAVRPTTNGSLLALSSYGNDKLWAGEFINGKFQVIWEWDFGASDGYDRVQGPFGLTWVELDGSLYLVCTHFESHSLSIFDFTNWEARDISRAMKLYSASLSQR